MTTATDLFCAALEQSFNPNPLQRKVLNSYDQEIYLYKQRRSGVSTALQLLALKHAVTATNKKVLVLMPNWHGLQEWFRGLQRIIEDNESFKALIQRTQKAPHLKVEFMTGSIIMGVVIDESSRSAICGLAGDTIIVDQADWISEEGWRTIVPIMSGDAYRKSRTYKYVGATYEGSPYFYQQIFQNTSKDRKVIL